MRFAVDEPRYHRSIERNGGFSSASPRGSALDRAGGDSDALLRQVDAQDGAVLAGTAPLGVRCPRIVGGDRALTHVRLDVLMAEGDVIPAAVTDLVGEDR